MVGTSGFYLKGGGSSYAIALFSFLFLHSFLPNTRKLVSKRVARRSKVDTYVNLWLLFSRTRVYLRWIVFTLIELKFVRKLAEVFHRLATDVFGWLRFLALPNTNSAQYIFSSLVAKVTSKSLFANWQPMECVYAQAGISTLVMTCDSVWPKLNSNSNSNSKHVNLWNTQIQARGWSPCTSGFPKVMGLYCCRGVCSCGVMLMTKFFLSMKSSNIGPLYQ